MPESSPKALRDDPQARERTCIYCIQTYSSAAAATVCEQDHESKESASVLGARVKRYRRAVFGIVS